MGFWTLLTNSYIAATAIVHATIVSNKARSADGVSGNGGGISGNGTVELQNSIVANNRSGTTVVAASDILSSGGSGANIILNTSSGNLVGDAATASGLVHATLGNILGNNGSGILPLSSILDSTLRKNGGRTMTHALLPTSPAIDKGLFNYVGTGANVDQRGKFRPRDYPSIANSGDGRDIGAYELREIIDLANLSYDGVNIFGADANDLSGFSVNSAEDVNGDGFDDLIIGAYRADALGNAKSFAGDSYLIFGKADWSTTPAIDLASLGELGPSVGITIFGAEAIVKERPVGRIANPSYRNRANAGWLRLFSDKMTSWREWDRIPERLVFQTHGCLTPEISDSKQF
jgi:hypothetical protein